MKIAIGHPIAGDEKFIDADAVRFVADDGRTMFEVRWMKDGRSIEVRGVANCRVGGVLYDSCIDVRPRVGNCVEVRAREYGDR